MVESNEERASNHVSTTMETWNLIWLHVKIFAAMAIVRYAAIVLRNAARMLLDARPYRALTLRKIATVPRSATPVFATRASTTSRAAVRCSGDRSTATRSSHGRGTQKLPIAIPPLDQPS